MFVQFAFFKLDSKWRRLSKEARQSGRRSFADALTAGHSDIETFCYSTIGLRHDTDFMLWRSASEPEPLQEGISQLLRSELGTYLDVSHVLFGLTRPSVYTGNRTAQDQAVEEKQRLPYFVLYPFTKTSEWYLLSKETRQGMMNEHIRVGRSFPAIRQVLLYSTGLADQEFIVGYETENLAEFQDLVIALRSTEGRKYTLQDTPIFTCIHRTLEETLDLLG